MNTVNSTIQSTANSISGNLATTIANYQSSGWKFCPEDGTKFEEGWGYCPKCGRGRSGSVLGTYPYGGQITGGTVSVRGASAW